MPQGTIKSFDPTTSSGTLVTDTLDEFTYDAEAFAGSRMLHLRFGQRVRFDVVESSEGDNNTVENLRIVTL